MKEWVLVMILVRGGILTRHIAQESLRLMYQGRTAHARTHACRQGFSSRIHRFQGSALSIVFIWPFKDGKRGVGCLGEEMKWV
jgi:hypothetical protein